MKRIEEVTLLYEVSEALNANLDLKKSLYRVLDLLSNSMNMIRGTITILDPIKNEIHIEEGIRGDGHAGVRFPADPQPGLEPGDDHSG